MKKISNLFVLIAMILLLNATSIFASRNMEITEMTKSYESPSVYAVSPVNAGMTDDRGKTIQITSKNRVMGFAEDRIYIVGEGYFFMEHFGGTKGVTPQRSGEDKIVYTDLWPGITLNYEKQQEGLVESIYEIHPGGDIDDIRLKYNGNTTIADNGDLQLSGAAVKGSFTLTSPIAWQDNQGVKKYVEVSFVQYEDKAIGFAVGPYNENTPLFIDPVYKYHFFFGSDSTDMGNSITVDASGNIYIAGYSDASWNVPLGLGYFSQPKNDHSGGNNDIMVIKLNSMGTYLWHTFYGSSYNDNANNIVVDENGDVYILGDSHESWNGPGFNAFPKHPYSDRGDAVIIKLDSNGNFEWHTFVGGLGDDNASELAIDASGNLYVTGSSDASWNGPGSAAPLNAYSGDLDILVFKLNSSGDYLWHTFYGSDAASAANDTGYAIGLDSSGNIVVTGGSYLSWDGPAGQQPLHAMNAFYDLVLLKLDSSGAYQWHTFYGSPHIDFATDLTLDKDDNIYLTGKSNATWNGPQANAPLHDYNGSNDIFAAGFNNNGEYIWHTFYGSVGAEQS